MGGSAELRHRRGRPSRQVVISPPAALVQLLRRPAWHALAVCRGEPVALFFPEPGILPITGSSVARTLCARCPVRRACADAGAEEPDGIWGGTAPEERSTSMAPAAVIEHASLA